MEYLIIICLIIAFVNLFYFFYKQRKVVNELLTNKRVLSTFLTYMPGILFQYLNDSRRTTKYFNKEIYEITGYFAGSFINNKELSYVDIIYPADKHYVIDTFQNLTPRKKTYRIEYRIITRDGIIKWLAEHGVGIFNKKGKLLSVEGLILDISERKSVDEYLLESNARFLEIIDQAPLGICILYDEIISYGNPVFCDMFNLKGIEDVTGASILNQIAQENQERFAKGMDQCQYKTKFPYEIETIGIHNDGSKFPVQVFISNVNMEGRKAFLMFFIDITDRKKGEENILSINQRLNDIIELIPDPTFIIDKNKTLTHWNLAMEELTGIKKEQVVGQGDYIYGKAFYGYARPMLLDILDMDNKQIEEEYEYVKKVNNKVYAEFAGNILNKSANVYLWGVAAPLYDNTGNRFGAIELIKDITESKIKELALIESEKKARLVLDSNQDYIILIQPDGTIQDCNLKFTEWLEKPRNELISHKVFEFFKDDVLSFWQSILNEVLISQESKILEYNWENNQGYFLVSVYPTFGKTGKVDYIVVCAKNITKLKSTELALRDSKERLDKITKSITDFTYKMHFDKKLQKYHFFYQGNGLIFGYKGREFDSNPRLWRDAIYDEDKEKIDQFLSDILIKRNSDTIEYRIYHKNGSIVWVSNTLLYFNDIGDDVLEFLGVVKDISARKHAEIALSEAEDRYRRVFDQSELANNVYDLDGNLIMQNALAASMLGGKPEDFIGKKIEEIFSPQMVKIIRTRINETIHNKSFVNEVEVTLPTGKYWLKTSNQVIRNDVGDIIAIQLISQDITEKKELDRKIINMIIDTEEKERVYFAQELHDGLGPIISAIKMYINWINMPDAKIPRSEIIKDTEHLLDEASQAIREISFKLSPHILKNFGLVEAIKSYVEKIQKSKNIVIQIESRFDERFNEITETILYRILCECINNTIKHANASNIIINFKKFTDRYRILFLDDGIGFDVKAALNKKSGNGLFNIQSRLESINSKMFIKSKPELGTKIYLTIRR